MFCDYSFHKNVLYTGDLMTILVKIAYDGTNYHGFQIQDDVPTVFGVFQDALLKILGHPTEIKGCSRTDSGVHAKCYYLSFETEKLLHVYRWHSMPTCLQIFACLVLSRCTMVSTQDMTVRARNTHIILKTAILTTLSAINTIGAYHHSLMLKK